MRSQIRLYQQYMIAVNHTHTHTHTKIKIIKHLHICLSACLHASVYMCVSVCVCVCGGGEWCVGMYVSTALCFVYQLCKWSLIYTHTKVWVLLRNKTRVVCIPFFIANQSWRAGCVKGYATTVSYFVVKESELLITRVHTKYYWYRFSSECKMTTKASVVGDSRCTPCSWMYFVRN